MPEVEQSVVFDRKKPSLMVRFVPVVMRNGRYQQLVSFMVAVQSKAVKRSVRRANARKAEAAAAAYADHSVLASGRWVKIRVPQDGIYNITNELISRAGFSNPAKVKIYGYGGHLQNEKLLASELAATDDLQEVPTCEVAAMAAICRTRSSLPLSLPPPTTFRRCPRAKWQASGCSMAVAR